MAMTFPTLQEYLKLDGRVLKVERVYSPDHLYEYALYLQVAIPFSMYQDEMDIFKHVHNLINNICNKEEPNNVS